MGIQCARKYMKPCGIDSSLRLDLRSPLQYGGDSLSADAQVCLSYTLTGNYEQASFD